MVHLYQPNIHYTHLNVVDSIRISHCIGISYCFMALSHYIRALFLVFAIHMLIFISVVIKNTVYGEQMLISRFTRVSDREHSSKVYSDAFPIYLFASSFYLIFIIPHISRFTSPCVCVCMNIHL